MEGAAVGSSKVGSCAGRGNDNNNNGGKAGLLPWLVVSFQCTLSAPVIPSLATQVTRDFHLVQTISAMVMYL